MAVFWNKVCLVGYLVNDPKVEKTFDGKSIGRFVLVSSSNSSKKSITIPIACFGVTADNVKTYLKKGHLVLVEGALNQYVKTSKGKPYYNFNVTAQRVIFISSKSPSINSKENDDQNQNDLQISENFHQDDTDIDSPF